MTTSCKEIALDRKLDESYIGRKLKIWENVRINTRKHN